MTQTVIQEKEGDRRGSKEEPREVGRGCEKGSDQQREVNTEYQPVNLYFLNADKICCPYINHIAGSWNGLCEGK